MEKEIQLLPEQVRKIEDKLEMMKKKRKELIEISKKIDVGNSDLNQGFTDIPDFSYQSEMAYIENQIAELINILKSSKIIEEYDEDCISIGTRFAATCDYNGEMETAEYILTDTKEGTISEGNREVTDAISVTPNSPFGKAVLKKRIGDPIVYSVRDMTVVGFIEDIIPQKINHSPQKTK